MQAGSETVGTALPTAGPPPMARRADVQGLRAIAVIMVVLFLLLVIYLLVDKGRVLEVMLGTVSELLRHLTILFVPAGVGVMTQLNRIGQEWLPIVVATVVSTWLSIAAGALVTRALMRRMGRIDHGGGEGHEELAP